MSLSNGRTKSQPFNLFLFLLFFARFIDAQSPSTSNNNGPNFSSRLNPSTAIIIVLLVSSFFFLSFFSIYIRTCNNRRRRHDNSPTAATTAATAAEFIRFQRGLNPQLLQTFPTLMYSEVKHHKTERSELECAICLGEFDDEDIIRLLPACDHVFHLDCIDAWLATRVTCPVCRTNYNLYSPPETVSPSPATAHNVAIAVDDMERRKEEMRELAVLASKARRNGARRSRRLSRSHSTGHLMGEGEASFNRYTLRLPENLRKEIIAAGSLRKAMTFTVAVNVGEGSMRKDSRGVGEGSSRRGRTIHLGRSDRWPSFFGRSLSARISSFGNRRKGDEGDVKQSP